MPIRNPLVPRIALVIAIPALLVPYPSTTAQAPQTPVTLTTSQQDQLRDLGKRILEHADRAGCKKNCTILVVNFTDDSGFTSVLGMQLADALSAQLTAESRDIRIADRHLLQSFLERERIPSKLLEEDNAARWLAMENSANSVIVGYLKETAVGVQLRVQLLDAHELVDKKPGKEGPVQEIALEGLNGALIPAEPFGKAPPQSKDAAIFKPGVRGVSTPGCQYCPNPNYTDPARIAKFKGNVSTLVTVSPEGNATEVQILRGAPYGLNQSTFQTVSSWRFRPATKDGNPVPTLVPVEVTFRLY